MNETNSADTVNITGQTTYVPDEQTVIFTKTERAYAFLTFIFAFLYVEFQIFSPAGFITSALDIAVITASIIFLKKQGCKFTAFNKMTAVFLYLFSCVFSVTDNGLIKFLTAVFLFGAGAYFVYSAAKGERSAERYLPFAMFKALLEFPLSHFLTGIKAARQTSNRSKAAGNIKYVIIGLLITAPVTFIVAVLLMSADKGMEDIMKSIFKNFNVMTLIHHIWRFALAVPCGLYLYGMLYSNAKHGKEYMLDSEKCGYITESARFVQNTIIYSAVTPILILYVIFFISQANYFLSAFAGNLPDGYSYSEYARRGFFELCAVTIINLLLITFISLFAQKGGKEKPAVMKFYTTSIGISTLILIAVSVSKMVMYISEYGLTRLRYFTMWFMILCGMIFVLIIVKQFRFEINFSAWSTGIFTVMLALLCFVSPDYVIARYNIEMYESGKLEELDISQLNTSDDAVLYALDKGMIDENSIEYYNLVKHTQNRETAQDYMNIPALIVHSRLKDVEINDYYGIAKNNESDDEMFDYDEADYRRGGWD